MYLDSIYSQNLTVREIFMTSEEFQVFISFLAFFTQMWSLNSYMITSWTSS